MELKIRNVDPVAVKKIDELAKNLNLSRQEFLKRQLETLAFYQQQNDREAELENLIDRNIQMMERCAISMENLNEFLNEMIGDEEE